MLKVKKHRGVIAVSGQNEKKHSFILLAFTWAFAIHFAAVILFHISPLNILGKGVMETPPATVTTEWKEEIVSSIDESFKEGALKSPPKRPVFEKRLPDVIASRMLILPWEKWFQNEITAYLDQTFIKELAVMATGIDLFISGDLADRAFEWKNPPKEIPEGLESYPAIAKFEVVVHEATGEIFKKKFLEGDIRLAKIAGEWLNQVQFTPQADRFSVKGEMLWMVGPP